MYLSSELMLVSLISTKYLNLAAGNLRHQIMCQNCRINASIVLNNTGTKENGCARLGQSVRTAFSMVWYGNGKKDRGTGRQWDRGEGDRGIWERDTEAQRKGQRGTSNRETD